jgi:hypothetical protein
MLGQQLRNTFDSSMVHPYYWGIVGTYIAVNALFGLVYSLSPDSVSFLFPPINAIAPNFPIIMEPVEWLVKHSNPERAELIVHIYGFGWLSLIFLIPVFLLIAIYAYQKFYEANRELATRDRDVVEYICKRLLLGTLIMLPVLWVFLYKASDGPIKFTGPCSTYNNCVHKRDFDLIKVVLFNSFFLLLSFHALLHVVISFRLYQEWKKQELSVKGLR